MCLNSLSGNSQYFLKGKIKDYKENDNIMASSVLVFSLSDTSNKTPIKPFGKDIHTFIKGTVSNKNGDFYIDSIPINKFNLLISLFGYEKFLIKNIAFSKKETIDLGNIYLFERSSISGFNDQNKGDLDEIRKSEKKEFYIQYPKDGNNLKMKIEDEIVTVNYSELLESRFKNSNNQ